ncbi:methylated-DNA--[protein]-cysteine S-methyltransferase [Telmatospirillum sp.]|uniref:methylated-DNA--[protein]-cysteine S-methyltransferase n=1 Tax=Telmatospirillum sp. TaxID=2079197 RepID=UPI00284D9F1E|nr:methylated-DNA--[protein]-cysteine S-methyltransferase [Telmatospirillum sp.]MDR3439380.1 methylated-DNA--[protein]-cysteine S-methyltransferase [Telmatospirillum sp.]
MSPATDVFTLSHMTTPIGTMVLLTDRQGYLRALDWDEEIPRLHRLLRRHYSFAVEIVEGTLPASISQPLSAYFAGHIDAVDAVPLKTGGTTFQRTVWAALRCIPPGKTTSYGALAATIGRPTAVRAVGLANGANPIGIVVPCHRVIGADGSLTGYAGGIARKRWLLDHEAGR